MRTKWKEDDQELQVKSPLSGVITAMAPVEDVSLAITTEFKENGSKDLYHLFLNDVRFIFVTHGVSKGSFKRGGRPLFIDINLFFFHMLFYYGL